MRDEKAKLKELSNNISDRSEAKGTGIMSDLLLVDGDVSEANEPDTSGKSALYYIIRGGQEAAGSLDLVGQIGFCILGKLISITKVLSYYIILQFRFSTKRTCCNCVMRFSGVSRAVEDQKLLIVLT